MNLRQLQAIQAVAELGSVTAAASRLGLTQSAVSRIIGTVEAEFGIKLFERHKRRLIPSTHSAAFLARTARLVTDMHELEASARNIRQGKAERLRIISVPPFLLRIVPLVVARRIKANPHLTISVEGVRRADIADWITRRDFDIAIAGLPVDRPEVLVNPLPPVDAVAVLPSNHRLAARRRLRLKDVLDGPLVTHSAGPLMRAALDRALARQGLRPEPIVEVSSAWLVCAMVRAGTGLAVVDPFTALACAGPDLAVRPLADQLVLNYGVLSLRERPLSIETATLANEIYKDVAVSVRSNSHRTPKG